MSSNKGRGIPTSISFSGKGGVGVSKSKLADTWKRTTEETTEEPSPSTVQKKPWERKPSQLSSIATKFDKETTENASSTSKFGLGSSRREFNVDKPSRFGNSANPQGSVTSKFGASRFGAAKATDSIKSQTVAQKAAPSRVYSPTQRVESPTQESAVSRVNSPNRETALSRVKSPTQKVAPSTVESPTQIQSLSRVESPTRKPSPSRVESPTNKRGIPVRTSSPINIPKSSPSAAKKNSPQHSPKVVKRSPPSSPIQSTSKVSKVSRLSALKSKGAFKSIVKDVGMLKQRIERVKEFVKKHNKISEIQKELLIDAIDNESYTCRDLNLIIFAGPDLQARFILPGKDPNNPKVLHSSTKQFIKLAISKLKFPAHIKSKLLQSIQDDHCEVGLSKVTILIKSGATTQNITLNLPGVLYPQIIQRESNIATARLVEIVDKFTAENEMSAEKRNSVLSSIYNNNYVLEGDRLSVLVKDGEERQSLELEVDPTKLASESDSKVYLPYFYIAEEVPDEEVAEILIDIIKSSTINPESRDVAIKAVKHRRYRREGNKILIEGFKRDSLTSSDECASSPELAVKIHTNKKFAEKPKPFQASISATTVDSQEANEFEEREYQAGPLSPEMVQLKHQMIELITMLSIDIKKKIELICKLTNDQFRVSGNVITVRSLPDPLLTVIFRTHNYKITDVQVGYGVHPVLGSYIPLRLLILGTDAINESNFSLDKKKLLTEKFYSGNFDLEKDSVKIEIIYDSIPIKFKFGIPLLPSPSAFVIPKDDFKVKVINDFATHDLTIVEQNQVVQALLDKSYSLSGPNVIFKIGDPVRLHKIRIVLEDSEDSCSTPVAPTPDINDDDLGKNKKTIDPMMKIQIIAMINASDFDDETKEILQEKLDRFVYFTGDTISLDAIKHDGTPVKFNINCSFDEDSKDGSDSCSTPVAASPDIVDDDLGKNKKTIDPMMKIKIIDMINAREFDEETKKILQEKLDRIVYFTGDIISLDAIKNDGTPVKFNINFEEGIKKGVKDIEKVHDKTTVSGLDVVEVKPMEVDIAEVIPKSSVTKNISIPAEDSAVVEDVPMETNELCVPAVKVGSLIPVNKGISDDQKNTVVGSEEKAVTEEKPISAHLDDVHVIDKQEPSPDTVSSTSTPLTEDMKMQLSISIKSSVLDEETKQLLLDEINNHSTLEGDIVKLTTKKEDGTPIELTINVSHIMDAKKVTQQQKLSFESSDNPTPLVELPVKKDASMELGEACIPPAEVTSLTLVKKIPVTEKHEAEQEALPVMEEKMETFQNKNAPSKAINNVPGTTAGRNVIHKESPVEEDVSMESDEPSIPLVEAVSSIAVNKAPVKNILPSSTPITDEMKHNLIKSLASIDVDEETKGLLLDEINKLDSLEGNTVKLETTKKDGTPIVLTINISHILNSQSIKSSEKPQSEMEAAPPDVISEEIPVEEDDPMESDEPSIPLVEAVSSIAVNKTPVKSISQASTPITDEMKHKLIESVTSSDLDDETKYLLLDEINKLDSLEGDTVKLEATKKDGTPIVLKINISHILDSHSIQGSDKPQSKVGSPPSKLMKNVPEVELTSEPDRISEVTPVVEDVPMELDEPSIPPVEAVSSIAVNKTPGKSILQASTPITEEIKHKLIESVTSSDLDDETKDLLLDEIHKLDSLEGDTVKLEATKKDGTPIVLTTNISHILDSHTIKGSDEPQSQVGSLPSKLVKNVPKVKLSAESDRISEVTPVVEDVPMELDEPSIPPVEAVSSIAVNKIPGKSILQASTPITDEMNHKLIESVTSSDLDDETKDLLLDEIHKLDSLEGDTVKLEATKKDGTPIVQSINISHILDSHSIGGSDKPQSKVGSPPSKLIKNVPEVKFAAEPDRISDVTPVVEDVPMELDEPSIQPVEAVSSIAVNKTPVHSILQASTPITDEMKHKLIESVTSCDIDDETKDLLLDEINKLDSLEGDTVKLEATKNDGTPIVLTINISHILGSHSIKGSDEPQSQVGSRPSKLVKNVPEVKLTAEPDRKSEDVPMELDEPSIPPVEAVSSIAVNKTPVKSILQASTPITEEMKHKLIESVTSCDLDDEAKYLLLDEINKLDSLEGDTVKLEATKKDGTPIVLTTNISHILHSHSIKGSDEPQSKLGSPPSILIKNVPIKKDVPMELDDPSLSPVEAVSSIAVNKAPNTNLKSLETPVKEAEQQKGEEVLPVIKEEEDGARPVVETDRPPEGIAPSKSVKNALPTSDAEKPFEETVPSKPLSSTPLTDEIKLKLIESITFSDFDIETQEMFLKEINKLETLEGDTINLEAVKKNGTPIVLKINISHILNSQIIEESDKPQSNTEPAPSKSNDNVPEIKLTAEPDIISEELPVVEDVPVDSDEPSIPPIEAFSSNMVKEVPDVNFESVQSPKNTAEEVQIELLSDFTADNVTPEQTDNSPKRAMDSRKPLKATASSTPLTDVIKQKIIKSIASTDLDKETQELILHQLKGHDSVEGDTINLEAVKKDGTPILLTINISQILSSQTIEETDKPDSESESAPSKSTDNVPEIKLTAEPDIICEELPVVEDVPMDSDETSTPPVEAVSSNVVNEVPDINLESVEIIKESGEEGEVKPLPDITYDDVSPVQTDDPSKQTSVSGKPLKDTAPSKPGKNISPTSTPLTDEIRQQLIDLITSTDLDKETQEVLLEEIHKRDSLEGDTVKLEAMKQDGTPIVLTINISHILNSQTIEGSDKPHSKPEGAPSKSSDNIPDIKLTAEPDIIYDEIPVVEDVPMDSDEPSIPPVEAVSLNVVNKAPDINLESVAIIKESGEESEVEPLPDITYDDVSPVQTDDSSKQTSDSGKPLKDTAPSKPGKNISPTSTPLTDEIRQQLIDLITSTDLDKETQEVLLEEIHKRDSFEGDTVKLEAMKKDGTPIVLTINMSHILNSQTIEESNKPQSNTKAASSKSNDNVPEIKLTADPAVKYDVSPVEKDVPMELDEPSIPPVEVLSSIADNIPPVKSILQASTPITDEMKHKLIESVTSSDLDDETKNLLLDEINKLDSFEGDTVKLEATNKDGTPIVLTINISHILDSHSIGGSDKPQSKVGSRPSKLIKNVPEVQLTAEPDRISDVTAVEEDVPMELDEPFIPPVEAVSSNVVKEVPVVNLESVVTPKDSGEKGEGEPFQDIVADDVSSEKTSDSEKALKETVPSKPGEITCPISTLLTDEIKQQLIDLITSTDLDKETQEVLLEEIHKRDSLEGDTVKLEAMKKDGTPIVLTINISHILDSQTIEGSDQPHSKPEAAPSKLSDNIPDIKLTAEPDIIYEEIPFVEDVPMDSDEPSIPLVEAVSANVVNEVPDINLESVEIIKESGEEGVVKPLPDITSDDVSPVQTDDPSKQTLDSGKPLKDTAPSKPSENISPTSTPLTDEIRQQLIDLITSTDLDKETQELLLEEIRKRDSLEGDTVKLETMKKDGTPIVLTINISHILNSQIIEEADKPHSKPEAVPSKSSDNIPDIKLTAEPDIIYEEIRVVEDVPMDSDEPFIPPVEAVSSNVVNEVPDINLESVKIIKESGEEGEVKPLPDITYDDVSPVQTDDPSKQTSVSGKPLKDTAPSKPGENISPTSTPLTDEIRQQLIDLITSTDLDKETQELMLEEIHKRDSLEGDTVKLEAMKKDGTPIVLTINISHILNSLIIEEADKSHSKPAAVPFKSSDNIPDIKLTAEPDIVYEEIPVVEDVPMDSDEPFIPPVEAVSANVVNEVPDINLESVEIIKESGEEGEVKPLPDITYDDVSPVQTDDPSKQTSVSGKPLKDSAPSKPGKNISPTSTPLTDEIRQQLIDLITSTDLDKETQEVLLEEIHKRDSLEGDTVKLEAIKQDGTPIVLTINISHILNSQTIEGSDKPHSKPEGAPSKSSDNIPDIKLTAEPDIIYDEIPVVEDVPMDSDEPSIPPVEAVSLNVVNKAPDINLESVAIIKESGEEGEVEPLPDITSDDVSPVQTDDSSKQTSDSGKPLKDTAPSKPGKNISPTSTPLTDEIRQQLIDLITSTDLDKETQEVLLEEIHKRDSLEGDTVKLEAMKKDGTPIVLTINISHILNSQTIEGSDQPHHKPEAAPSKLSDNIPDIKLTAEPDIIYEEMPVVEDVAMDSDEPSIPPVEAVSLNVVSKAPDSVQIIKESEEEGEVEPLPDITSDDVFPVQTDDSSKQTSDSGKPLKDTAPSKPGENISPTSTPLTDEIRQQLIDLITSTDLDKETQELMLEEIHKRDSLKGDTVKLEAMKKDGTPIVLTINISHILNSQIIEEADKPHSKPEAVPSKSSDNIPDIKLTAEPDIIYEEMPVVEDVAMDSDEPSIPPVEAVSLNVVSKSPDSVQIIKESEEEGEVKPLPNITSDDVFPVQTDDSSKQTSDSGKLLKNTAPSKPGENISPTSTPLTDEIRQQLIDLITSTDLDKETQELMLEEIHKRDSLKGDTVKLEAMKKDGTPIVLTINISHILNSQTIKESDKPHSKPEAAPSKSTDRVPEIMLTAEPAIISEELAVVEDVPVDSDEPYIPPVEAVSSNVVNEVPDVNLNSVVTHTDTGEEVEVEPLSDIISDDVSPVQIDDSSKVKAYSGKPLKDTASSKPVKNICPTSTPLTDEIKQKLINSITSTDLDKETQELLLEEICNHDSLDGDTVKLEATKKDGTPIFLALNISHILNSQILEDTSVKVEESPKQAAESSIKVTRPFKTNILGNTTYLDVQYTIEQEDTANIVPKIKFLPDSIKRNLTVSITSSELDEEVKEVLLNEINKPILLDGDTVKLTATKKDGSPIELTISLVHVAYSQSINESNIPQFENEAALSKFIDNIPGIKLTMEPDFIPEETPAVTDVPMESDETSIPAVDVASSIAVNEFPVENILPASTPTTETIKHQLILSITSSNFDQETKELLLEEIKNHDNLDGDTVKLEATKKDGTPILLTLNISHVLSSEPSEEASPVETPAVKDVPMESDEPSIPVVHVASSIAVNEIPVEKILPASTPTTEKIKHQLILSITSSNFDQETKELLLDEIKNHDNLDGDTVKLEATKKDGTPILLTLNISHVLSSETSEETSTVEVEESLKQAVEPFIKVTSPIKINVLKNTTYLDVQFTIEQEVGPDNITPPITTLPDNLKQQLIMSITSSELDKEVKELLLNEINKHINLDGDTVKLTVTKKDGSPVELTINIIQVTNPKSDSGLTDYKISDQVPHDYGISERLNETSITIHLDDVHITLAKELTLKKESTNTSIPVDDEIRSQLLKSLKASSLDDETLILLEKEINMLETLVGSEMKLRAIKEDGNSINLIININKITKTADMDKESEQPSEMVEKDVENLGDVSLLVSPNVEDSPVTSLEHKFTSELTEDIKMQMVRALKNGNMNDDLVELFSTEIEKLNYVEGDDVHLSCKTHDGIPVELTINIKNIMMTTAHPGQVTNLSSSPIRTKDVVKITEAVNIVCSTGEEMPVSTTITGLIRSQIVESLKAGNVDVEVVSLIRSKLDEIKEILGDSMVLYVRKEDGTPIELTINLTHVKNFFRAIPPHGGSDDNGTTTYTNASVDVIPKGDAPEQADLNDDVTPTNDATPTNEATPTIEAVTDEQPRDYSTSSFPMTDDIKSQILDSLKSANLDDETFNLLKDELDKIHNLDSDQIKLKATKNNNTPIELTINISHLTKDLKPSSDSCPNDGYEMVDMPTQLDECKQIYQPVDATAHTDEGYEMIKGSEDKPENQFTTPKSNEELKYEDAPDDVSDDGFELLIKAEEVQEIKQCREVDGFEMLTSTEVPKTNTSSPKPSNDYEPSVKADSDDSYEFVAPIGKDHTIETTSLPLQAITCQCRLILAQQEREEHEVKTKLTDAVKGCGLDEESVDLILKELEKTATIDSDILVLEVKKKDGTPVILTLNIDRVLDDVCSIETPVDIDMKSQIIESLKSGKLDDETIQLLDEELSKVDYICGDNINLTTSKSDGTPISLTINIKHFIKNVTSSPIYGDDDTKKLEDSTSSDLLLGSCDVDDSSDEDIVVGEDLKDAKKPIPVDKDSTSSDLLLGSCDIDDSSDEDIFVEKDLKDAKKPSPVDKDSTSSDLLLGSCDIDDSSDEDIFVEEDLKDAKKPISVDKVLATEDAIALESHELLIGPCDLDEETYDDEIFVEEDVKDVVNTQPISVKKPAAIQAEYSDEKSNLKPIFVSDDVKSEILVSLKTSGLDDETIELLAKELQDIESVDTDSINLKTAKKDGTPINLTINIKHIVRSLTPIPFDEGGDVEQPQLLLESHDVKSESELSGDELLVEEDVKEPVKRAPLTVNEPIDIDGINKEIKTRSIWADDQEYFLLEGMPKDIPISLMLDDKLSNSIKEAIKKLDITVTAKENLINELESLNMIPYGDNGLLKTTDSRIVPVAALVNLVIEHAPAKEHAPDSDLEEEKDSDKERDSVGADVPLVEVVIDILDYSNIEENGKLQFNWAVHLISEALLYLILSLHGLSGI